MTEFINSVTTNLTAFFREKHHFDYLASTVIPELLQKKQAAKEIRAWSSACSTGEEAYSIAMVVKELLPKDWRFTLLATDLDTRVLAQAESGIYSRDIAKTITDHRLKRWFLRGKGGQADKIRVKATLAEDIQFKQLNLIDEWPIRSVFDFIFCRNVFIYFDTQTKKQLVERFSRHLMAGGYFFIGHSESLQQLSKAFKLEAQTTYKKL
ncbi:MAG: CheR family methyltransferase [Methylococcales bacterium]|nr:CheR family methyltransferase [Methylococcales bacterium]